MWRIDDSSPQRSAVTHSTLVLIPHTAENQVSGNGRREHTNLGGILVEGARVAYPTFPQFDFDSNCHTVEDYLRDKTKNQENSKIFLFGRTFHVHQMRYDEGETNSLAREANLRIANTAVYKTVQWLGDPQRFLATSSHREFINGRREVLRNLCTRMKELRVCVDAVQFPDGGSSFEHKAKQIKLLVRHCWMVENSEMEAALYRVARNAPPLLNEQ